MNDKLKELTDKIYSEGVEKARNEAEIIIKDANIESDKLIKQAKQQAEEIIDNARKEAKELRSTVESEIKMSARQSMNSLKQRITDLLVTEISRDETQIALSDKDFVQKLIEKIIDKFASDSSESIDLTIIMSENDKEIFEDYFKRKHTEKLNKGLTVSFSDKISTGFEIGPADKTYKVSFTDETFEAFFRNYLRPRSVKLLYGE